MSINTKDSSTLFDGKNYIKVGLFCLVLFGGGLGSWMTLSQLDSAAIAPGIITVEGQRKAVEHLEGGIVAEVLVNDGDVVEKDQPLIKLSAITARTRFIQLNLKYYSLLAQEQRLHHERTDSEKLVFSERLLNKVSMYPSLASVLETQKLLFIARVNLKNSELSSIDAKLRAISSDKKMYAEKIEQEEVAISYLEKEVKIHEGLQANGYSSQLKGFELKRTQAKYSSSLIDLKGRLTNRKMAGLESKQLKIATEYRYISDIEQELQEVAKIKDDTLELLVQAEDVLSRVVIKSPNAGQVVGLTVFNKGDVISPGETLLEVVPFNERLIIVAKLKPEDIDVIKVGQSAMVRLSAYSFRSTPPIKGTVIHVAADRLIDPNDRGNDGFTIKVSIDKSELDSLTDVELHPGMPAEVFIKLNSRTPLDYLLEPLSLDLFRAFRES
jgi:HlyD family secretion protein